MSSFRLHNRPWELLLVSTGNITNRELERLIDANLALIVEGLEKCDYVELNRTSAIYHD